MARIAIYIEERRGELQNVGLELLSEVKRNLQDEVEIFAILLTNSPTKTKLATISESGAHHIIIAENPRFEDYDTSYFTHALSEIVNKYAFDVLLLGSTLLGRDLGPRLSARLHTGLTADATKLEFKLSEKLELYATRPALGGNLFATITCLETLPQMATVRPGVFSITKEEGHRATLTDFIVSFPFKSSVKAISRKKVVAETQDLTKAKIIIAGGRGVATMFSELNTMATLVGGEIAVSRAVVDANPESRKRLVGQTGQTVKPSVYVAFGISGAIQHVSGMEKSELIIAVNNDPSALIYNVADVGLISDALQVIPLVNDALRKL